MIIGETFQRPSDPTSPGPKRMQTWQIVRHLEKDIYECRLIDHVQDVMLSSNPQTRTFRERDIEKYLKNQ